MRVLDFIISVDGVCIRLQMNEMNNVKYEWTTEPNFVFSKEGPWVESHILGPHLRCFMLHQRFQCLMYMKCIIYKHEINEFNGRINRELLMNGHEYIV